MQFALNDHHTMEILHIAVSMSLTLSLIVPVLLRRLHSVWQKIKSGKEVERWRPELEVQTAFDLL